MCHKYAQTKNNVYTEFTNQNLQKIGDKEI